MKEVQLIQKGDLIQIKPTLFQDMVNVGFNKKQIKKFCNKYINTTQKVYNIYYDTLNGTNQWWVTVDLCAEIPLSSCVKIN
jgi:hypothetical protein